MRKRELLLATVKRLGLSSGDAEDFEFLVSYEKKQFGQTRPVRATKDILHEKIKLHKQWMNAVENMPEDIPCHAHTNERIAHRAI